MLRSGREWGLAGAMKRGAWWLALLITVAGASLAALHGPALSGRAQTPTDVLLQPQPLVVLADRPVCSLLSAYKQSAGIVGQDGSQTVAADGMVYWDFGDTKLAGGAMIPNSLGWSADTDASDCISLTPMQDGGGAVPLLATEPGELTVWPLGMEAIGAGRVGFYYASVVPDATRGWRVQGVGIGSFDTRTHVATRALGGMLVWNEDMPLPSRTFADEQYVYIFLTASRETWSTDTILARVPKRGFESPSSYEYWSPAAGGTGGRWVGGLWHAQTQSWDPSLGNMGALWRQPGMNNGVQVAYNEFLGRWVGVYTAAFMSSLNARTATAITGPWDESETVLVRCATFHSTAWAGFLCYTGAQHAAYTADGGRTIYVSYSNGPTYQVYLHEIRLASPINQWSDGQGHAVYLAGGRQGPPGYRLDGVAFYASDIPIPGFAPIHRWQGADTGEIRYGATSPEPPGVYQDMGVDFYAPTNVAAASATNASYAPVYRWRRFERQAYAALDLTAASGYAKLELAFYAACPDSDNDGASDCSESFLPASRPPATVTPTPTASSHGPLVFGDVNCDGAVDPIDAALILEFDVGAVRSLACPLNADVNQRGRIDPIDATLILQFTARIIFSLPPS